MPAAAHNGTLHYRYSKHTVSLSGISAEKPERRRSARFRAHYDMIPVVHHQQSFTRLSVDDISAVFFARRHHHHRFDRVGRIQVTFRHGDIAGFITDGITTEAPINTASDFIYCLGAEVFMFIASVPRRGSRC